MFFDQLSMWLALASPIVGLLAVVMVGSHAPGDARPIAGLPLMPLIPMLFVSCACLAFSPGWDHYQGGAGMVVMFSILILSVRLGHRIAKRGGFVPQDGARGKGGEL